MKKTLMALLLGLTMSTIMATAAFAEDVYVTKYGKKYHHANSRFLKNKDVEKITLEEAVERGLEPSKDYLKHKDNLLNEEIDSQDQGAKKGK